MGGTKCEPCAARRKRLAEQLKSVEISAAAKTAVVGVGIMTGLIKEGEKHDDENPSRA